MSAPAMRSAKAEVVTVEAPSLLDKVLSESTRRPVQPLSVTWEAQPQWATLYVQYMTDLLQQAAAQIRYEAQRETEYGMRREMEYRVEREVYERTGYTREQHRGGYMGRRRGVCKICGWPECNHPSRYDGDAYYEDRLNGW